MKTPDMSNYATTAAPNAARPGLGADARAMMMVGVNKKGVCLDYADRRLMLACKPPNPTFDLLFGGD